MTDKLKEYAEKQYPFKNNSASLNAFADGFQLGAEFEEWIRDKGSSLIWFGERMGWAVHSKANFNKDGKQFLTTPELTELFLTDKIKNNGLRNLR